MILIALIDQNKRKKYGFYLKLLVAKVKENAPSFISRNEIFSNIISQMQKSFLQDFKNLFILSSYTHFVRFLFILISYIFSKT